MYIQNIWILEFGAAMHHCLNAALERASHCNDNVVQVRLFSGSQIEASGTSGLDWLAHSLSSQQVALTWPWFWMAGT